MADINFDKIICTHTRRVSSYKPIYYVGYGSAVLFAILSIITYFFFPKDMTELNITLNLLMTIVMIVGIFFSAAMLIIMLVIECKTKAMCQLISNTGKKYSAEVTSATIVNYLYSLNISYISDGNTINITTKPLFTSQELTDYAPKKQLTICYSKKNGYFLQNKRI